MKNSLLIVTLATLSLTLSACASNLPQSVDSAPAAVIAQAPNSPSASEPAAQAGSIDATASPLAEDPLPSLALTEDMLFGLLSAEIAFQRGDWQSAYMTMLSLAQQTRDPRLARRAAEVAHVARQQSEVLSAVRLWRELAPSSDEATQYFLSFVVQSGALEDARPILAQRLKEGRPQSRPALGFQLQRLFARAKDQPAAFALVEQLLAPYVDMPEIRLALAQAAFVAGNAERARHEAGLALAAMPESELAVLTLAQMTTDKTEASNLLVRFLKRVPLAREVRLAHARLLVEDKKYGPARAEFEQLLATDAKDLTALYAIGAIGLQTGDLDGAEKRLTEYLAVLEEKPDQDRDPTQAMLLLAQIAEERKDTEGLLKWLARIDSGEAYVNAQIKRAQVMAKGGDLAAARELLREVTTSGERDEALLVMAEGQLLRDADRIAEALQVYQDGLKRMPGNTELMYDYAMLAEKNGDWVAMEESLRKIIDIAPKHQHALNALGYSLADRNVRLEEAYTLIKRALELTPEDPFIMDSMGWVQFRMGRLDEAEALLRRAYGMRPDAEIAAHLGEVLWVKGQREAAQALWRAAQAKDPQNDTLKSTLARLNASL